LGSDVADEEPAGGLVKVDRVAQKAGQQRGQRAHWDHATRIFDQKGASKIKIAPAHFGLRLSGYEVAIAIVKTHFPVPAFHAGADATERLQDFQQANVFPAHAIANRQRVGGDGGVDREALLVGCGRTGQQDESG
jgi:hypothetical protein